MNKAVEEIIVLGKDSIVQLALELIDENLETQNFSKIKVMTNGKTVYVSFLNPIKYLPMDSVFYFDYGVNLLEEIVTYGPVSNGIFDSDKKIPLYKPTKETKKSIQYVMDAINKSDEIDVIAAVELEEDMTIREYENFYSILVVSEFHESSYKIEKITGKIYDTTYAPLVPPPIFEDEDASKFIEIN
tara:strand:+ start:10259 stop:10819 length:561 start_codon:yes stop_codon:yes gene_type:complete